MSLWVLQQFAERSRFVCHCGSFLLSLGWARPSVESRCGLLLRGLAGDPAEPPEMAKRPTALELLCKKVALFFQIVASVE